MTKFVRGGGTRVNEGKLPSVHSEEEWSEGITDETSLGQTSVSCMINLKSVDKIACVRMKLCTRRMCHKS